MRLLSPIANAFAPRSASRSRGIVRLAARTLTVMIRTLALCLLLAFGLPAARAQNPPYVNEVVVLTDSHPPIDAPAFINKSLFIFTNFATPLAIDLFQNTLNYTNTATGILASSSGYRFDTYTPSALPFNKRRPASTFINEGTLGAGSVTVPGFGTFLLGFGANLSVNATNITSPGTIQLGTDSLLSLHGDAIDLSRATIEVQNGFSFGGAFGVQSRFFPTPAAGYWGLNSSASFSNLTTFDPITFEGFFPSTPNYAVTNRNYSLSFNSLGGTNFVSYLSDVLNLNASNRVVRAVFVSNTNSALTPSVFLTPFEDIVVFTNQFSDNTGATFTNYLYVMDDFGVRTNFQLVGNGIAGASRQTFIPINYSVFQTDSPFFFGGVPETPTNIPFGTFPPGNATNQYAAYQAQFQALTEDPTETAGGDVTNMTGRIEIVANKSLDLSRARISCQNSIVIQATNQFVGSELAQISSPYSDVSLRSGTGRLAVTNLIEPIINRAEGLISLYSARWTNVDNVGITNKFWVLFVDAQIAPAFPSRVEDLTLRSTNALNGDDSVFVSDFFTVTRSFLIDATSLTLTTNGPNAPSPFGAINVTAPGVVWSVDVAPRLQFLTNYGSLQAVNAVFFGSTRTSPYYSPDPGPPYKSFVNFGTVANFGSQIWADHFENHSNFIANGGYILLNHSLSATLADGAFFAPANLISLSANDLLITNHSIQCGNSLTLLATNSLDDGSLLPNSALAISNKNFWSVGAGIDLPILPPFASLLGTTVTNTSSPLANVINVWAGADRGPTPDGFRNNAALGHLILDGATNSTFTFAGVTGPAGSNALYVDCLEFTNFASALTPQGAPTNVVILPGMKVYYAQLLLNGIPFADKINETSARDGLGFYWVSNYNCGFFSSTEYPYPDPLHPGRFVTNRVNTALATSCDIDSYGNSGSNNCTRTVAPVPVAMLQNCNLYPPIAPPTITQQPSSIAPVAGANDNLSLIAKGAALAYQWRKGGSNLVDSFRVYGANTPKLSFTGVSAANNGVYDVIVANAAGVVTSSVATVVVRAAPVGPPTNAIPTNNIPPIIPPTNPAPALVKLEFPASGSPAQPGAVASALGSYNGLFSDQAHDLSVASSGYFAATISSRGACSGKLTLRGKSWPFSGRFDPNTGLAPCTVKRGSSYPWTLQLQLALADGDYQILGLLTDKPPGANVPRWSAQLQAYRKAPAGDLAGNYTFVIPPDPETAGPAGYGFGTVKVDPSGTLRWSGALADGSKVTQTTALSRQGFWPLHASLYNGNGLAIGWMLASSSSLDGQVLWLRPPGYFAKSSSVGFINDVAPIGSRYSSSGSPVIPLNNGAGLLTFSGANLAAPFMNSVFLDSRNRLSSTDASRPALKLNTASGLLTGTVQIPRLGKVAFQGVLVQDHNSGAGFFSSPTRTGQLRLDPAP